MSRRLRLAVVLATFGALVAIGIPAAHAEPASGTFRALSYNVAGLPEPLSGSEPATNSPLISPKLDAYDLVLLQENWADPLADLRQAGLVPELVPRLGYHDLVVGDANHPFRSEPAPNPLGLDFDRFPTGPPLQADGLNRLSQFEFGALERVKWQTCNGELTVSVVEEALSTSGLGGLLGGAGLGSVVDAFDGGAADCGAQKGFSVARTTLADGVVADVYNLHAEAGNGEADRVASRQQFGQLADFIAEHSAGHAVILGGDTNLHTDRPFDADTWSEFLAASGLHDVCDTVDCGADAHVIDKFAFRDGADVTLAPETHRFERDVFVDGDRPLSDHDALAVTFRWSTS